VQKIQPSTIVVVAVVVEPPDPSIDQELGAGVAWGVSAVDHTTFKRHPSLSRKRDKIRFRMDGTEAHVVLDVASDVHTMRFS
jgi:hypothetical protein